MPPLHSSPDAHVFIQFIINVDIIFIHKLWRPERFIIEFDNL